MHTSASTRSTLPLLPALPAVPQGSVSPVTLARSDWRCRSCLCAQTAPATGTTDARLCDAPGQEAVPYLSGTPRSGHEAWHREGAASASVAQWVRKGPIGGDRFATAAPRGRPRKCIRNGTLGLGAGFPWLRASSPVQAGGALSPIHSRPHFAQRQRSTWAEPRRGQVTHLSIMGFAVR